MRKPACPRRLAPGTAASGQGITFTIWRDLKSVAARNAYAKLRNLRGKVKFSTQLTKLRKD